MTKYATTDAARRAAIALLRSGLVSLSEVAELAGVSRQLVHWWSKHDGIVDWQPKRTAYLKRTWAKRLAKEKSAVDALKKT